MDDSRTMNIRHATAQDTQVIGEITFEAWYAAYSPIMAADFLQTLTQEKFVANTQRLFKQAHRPPCLVAEIDGTVLGFCSYGRSRDTAPNKQLNKDLNKSAEIYALNVTPNAWGKGVGSQLMQSATQELKQDFKYLYLWVAAENKRAVGFYKHLEFIANGQTKRLESHGDVLEARYSKQLNQS